jgi:hypothetical protein
MPIIWRRTRMNPYMNEEVAWQRIQDLQREMENSHLMAAGYMPPALVALVGLGRRVARLGRSAWNLPLGRFHRRYREAELATRAMAVTQSLEARAVQTQSGWECDEQMEIA